MTDTPQPPVDPYSGNLAGSTPVSGTSGSGTPQPPSYSPGYATPPTYPASAPPYGQQGYPVPYPQPAYAGQHYPVPYVQTHDPATGLPYSDKSKVVAGILQLVLGGFGAGRFYTGHTGIAIAQILVTFGTCGIGHIWGIIDGIMILVQGGTDSQGRPLRPS